MPKYRVMTGLDFPPDRRVEAGEVVEDIPSKSVKWLLEQGLIEVVDATGKAKDETPEFPYYEKTQSGKAGK